MKENELSLYERRYCNMANLEALLGAAKKGYTAPKQDNLELSVQEKRPSQKIHLEKIY